jgi:hypothetical protein
MVGLGKLFIGGYNMVEYEYVPKSEYLPVKEQLIELIEQVQREVSDFFIFDYDFIGSSSRNMITRQVNGNIGYDFDVNIHVGEGYNEYTPKEIRMIFMNALNRNLPFFSYKPAEDSTRVITIKVVNFQLSRIEHSCDFAIVRDLDDGDQQYIRFNKKQQSYYWEFQPEGYRHLDKKINTIKVNNLWNEVRYLYLYKKCNNTHPYKKSRSLFAETINEIYDRYFK